jgi:hypothetical protein
MAGNWQTVREAADELGVAPETLTRRLRSGRAAAAVGAGEDAPAVPPPAAPFPRPQPGATATGEIRPLPKPPLCTLPPAKPLPAPGALPTPSTPHRRASDASAAAEAAAASRALVPPRDRIDDAFLAAVEEELKEMRNHRGGGFVPAVLPAAPAPVPAEPIRSNGRVLDMADPLHAQVQDSKRQIRGMWVGIALMLVAVIAGVVWTTVRMDRAETMITTLIQQLDSERTLSASYKQEIARLFTALTDSKAQQSKLAGRTQKDNAGAAKRSDSRLTSGK